MQLNYYAIGQRIQDIRKERQLSQAMLSATICPHDRRRKRTWSI